MFELTIEDTFSAAHQLVGYGDPCEKVHGHTWKVAITLKGEKLNKIGVLLDFKIIKKSLSEIIEKLDHNFLNELPEFSKMNPSAENIAKYIYNKFKRQRAKGKNKVKLLKCTVWESERCAASFYE